jgi:hypothetical protein
MSTLKILGNLHRKYSDKEKTQMKSLRILFIFMFFFQSLLFSRPSSYPYISGDTFRAFCDYIYDETGNTVLPESIVYGDTIFLKTDYLSEFFREIHPKIANPYILVTHNGDLPIPREFGYVLDDPKLIVWFGQNVEHKHPKLKPIPIGIANRYWKHGDIDIVTKIQKLKNSKIQKIEKTIFLYMNFDPNTYIPERPYVFQLFNGKPFCTVASQKDFTSYLFDLAQSKFVLSPRGNGQDCHRTWESIYMGAIPIVTSSYLNPLFEGLPVIVINDWNEVTEEFLEIKYEKMCEIEYNRCYADYWFNLISSYKIMPISM